MARPGLYALRALALATDTSDVVGTVELCCYDEGLLVHFVRVSPYAPSYAPTPPVRGRAAVLPYEAVREAWDDGEALRLTLQHPHLPFRRLALTHVTRDGRYDHRSGHRRRLWAKGLAFAAALSALGAWVPIVQRLAPASAAFWGAAGALAIAAFARAALREFDRRSVLGGEASAAERRAFFHELASHLPPSLVRDSAPPAWHERAASPFARGPAAPANAPPGGEAASTEGAAAPSEEPGARWSGELAPTLVAAAATGLLGLLVLIASATSGDESESSAPAPTLEAMASSAMADLPTLAPPPPERAEMPAETCLCQTPLSPAVPQRVPRLTLLPGIKRRNLDPQKPSIEIELAIVNNSATEMREPQGVVSFQRPGRHPGEPPHDANDQSFYFEGGLESGAALKWRLRGRGTTFRIATSEEGYLGDGELASGDAFAKLLGARTRSVRLHGAAMLTRMRDERASAAVEKLREAGVPDEGPFLESLSRAAAPVYGCHLEAEVAETGTLHVSACVMNTAEEDSPPLDAELWLLPSPARTPVSTGEPDPAIVRSVVAERLRVPAKTGAVVRADVDAAAAQGVEIVADLMLRGSAARPGGSRPRP